MNPLFVAANEVSAFLSSRGWKHCVIGGLAVLRWGEARMTADIDLSLHAGFGEETHLAAPILERFTSRIPNAEAFAAENRVLLLRATNGISIDISLAALDFEIDMFERATSFEFAPGCVLPVCSAEDLFVLKSFAAREKDWIDAESIAIRCRDRLDTRYIFHHLSILADLKEAPEIITRAKRLLGEST